MTWNYRIVKRTSPIGEYYYALHEVYYKDGDIEKPDGRDMEPRGFVCGLDEGPEGIVASLKRALESVEKYPVMDDPWPDEILPHMAKAVPASETVADQIAINPQAYHAQLRCSDYDLGLGFLHVTSAMANIAPRVMFSLVEDLSSEMMTITLEQPISVSASSLPAFYRHAVGPKISAWAAANLDTLMAIWNIRSPDITAKRKFWTLIETLRKFDLDER